MFATGKEYFAFRRKVAKQAARSRLAVESPGTAERYAEVLTNQVEKLGMRGQDQYAVKDLIREYAEKVDLEPKIDGEKVTFRRLSPHHTRTR
jgi:hypothetical protein